VFKAGRYDYAPNESDLNIWEMNKSQSQENILRMICIYLFLWFLLANSKGSNK